jgi:hypothetical protein
VGTKANTWSLKSSHEVEFMDERQGDSYIEVIYHYTIWRWIHRPWSLVLSPVPGAILQELKRSKYSPFCSCSPNQLKVAIPVVIFTTVTTAECKR